MDSCHDFSCKQSCPQLSLLIESPKPCKYAPNTWAELVARTMYMLPVRCGNVQSYNMYRRRKAAPALRRYKSRMPYDWKRSATVPARSGDILLLERYVTRPINRLSAGPAILLFTRPHFIAHGPQSRITILELLQSIGISANRTANTLA